MNLISYPTNGVDVNVEDRHSDQDIQVQNESYWISKIVVNAIESIGNIAQPGNIKVVRSLIIQLANDDWEVRLVLMKTMLETDLTDH